MSGRTGPNRQRPHRARGLRTRSCAAQAAAAGLAALLLGASDSAAQTLTSDMLVQERDGFSGSFRPLQSTTTAQSAATASAPSRIGAIPTYDVPAAAGAGRTGFDSLNRRRQIARKRAANASDTTGSTNAGPTRIVPVTPAAPALPTAVKTPNRARIAPAAAGLVAGQPTRRPLRVDDDPFGAVGLTRGSFLVKPAIEFMTGYDTNPARINGGKGSWLYMISPELTAASNWERHSLTADLRGSFTGYGLRNEPAGPAALPTTIDRPEFNGRVNGRLDVSRDTRILSEARLHVGTDNPGSPNIQANLQRYPIFTSVGGSLGAAHSFNRFEVTATGTVDHAVYQRSTFSDGSTSTNEDRNFNQFGGVLRGSYEILPTIKPFGEVAVDRRQRDVRVDRFGYARNSSGETIRVGSTFELGPTITGEASIGYTDRKYEDPRLVGISGWVTTAALAWRASGLTTLRFAALSSVDESVLPGVSGAFTQTYTAEVEHAFRRYLVATLRAGLTNATYEGLDRADKIYSIGGDLIYKFNRDVWAKAQVRHDWLKSSIPTADYDATLFMLGLRLQR